MIQHATTISHRSQQLNMSSIISGEVQKAVSSLDLSKVAATLMAEEGMSHQQADMAISAYKTYLVVCHEAQKEGKTVIPFTLVDKVWHTHILLSVEQYRRDILSCLGFYLDHCKGANTSQSIEMGTMLESHYRSPSTARTSPSNWRSATDTPAAKQAL